jgi:GT2 family glycosyltransferase
MSSINRNPLDLSMGRFKRSIVVPTFNQAPLTVRCFESIKRNTSSDYELIWVDNGSAKDQFDAIYWATRRLCLPTKLIRFRKNMGFIKATNAGICAASSEYVILLNNDTEVGCRWDEKLIKPLHDVEVGAVGPVTQSPIAWQSVNNVNKRWSKNLPEFQGTADGYSKILDQKFGGAYIEITTGPLAFFCVAMRRELFAEIGLLDTIYGLGLAEDDDFCKRLRLADMKLMLSLGTFVYHHHRTTFRAIGANVDAMLRNNLKILREKKQNLVAL